MLELDVILDEIVDRTGLPPPAAQQALYTTLRALGEVLDADEVAALAPTLPAPQARVLREVLRASPLPYAEQLDERFAAVTGLPRGPARELVMVVCRALGNAMSPSDRALVVRSLRRYLAEWFEPVEPARAPSPADVASGAGRTLATGRPGSSHPLADSAPRQAHAHSVAHEANPHGDSKLSSGAGTTQERLGESLAAGKPNPGRPISESGPRRR